MPLYDALPPGLQGYDLGEQRNRQEAQVGLQHYLGTQRLALEQQRAQQAAQMQPLQMDILRARLAQQAQAAKEAEAKGAFFNPAELQRRGLIIPGQEAIPIPSAAVGETDPGRPATPPKYDLPGIMRAGAAEGVISPTAVAQFEANQQNREATLQQRERDAQMRYDLAMQRATNAEAKAKLDEWFKRENLAISQARLGLERQRVEKPNKNDPFAEVKAQVAGIMLKIGRGEKPTPQEQQMLNTYQRVPAMRAFMDDILRDAQNPQPAAQPNPLISGGAITRPSGQAPVYPPDAPPGLQHDPVNNVWFRVNNGRKEKWVSGAR